MSRVSGPLSRRRPSTHSGIPQDLAVWRGLGRLRFRSRSVSASLVTISGATSARPPRPLQDGRSPASNMRGTSNPNLGGTDDARKQINYTQADREGEASNWSTPSAFSALHLLIVAPANSLATD